MGCYLLLLKIVTRTVSHRLPHFRILRIKSALIIGFFQVLALMPGTSRSSATIIGALLIGTSRFVATEFSFFLSIPVMIGASGYKMLKFLKLAVPLR